MKKFFNQQNIQKKFLHTEAAFTLMEVMVAISIFAIIITIGIGSLLTIFSTLQKTRSDRQTLDSVSYMMDTITRQVRTAQTVELLDGSSFGLKIKNQDGDSIEFRTESVHSDSGDRESYYKLVMIKKGELYDLTPAEFQIESPYIFKYVSVENSQQGILRINISGTTKSGRNAADSPIFLQTAVSKRVFDYTASTPPSNDSGNSEGTGE